MELIISVEAKNEAEAYNLVKSDPIYRREMDSRGLRGRASIGPIVNQAPGAAGKTKYEINVEFLDD